MKKFRVPQSIRENLAEASDEFAKRIADGDPLTLVDLRRVYKLGNQFGEEGRRWARRILKKEGVLVEGNAPFQVPSSVDLLFGPVMFCGRTDLSAEQAAEELAKAGLSGLCSPDPDGTLVILSSSEDLLESPDGVHCGDTVYSTEPQGDLSMMSGNIAESIVVDDSRSRLQVMKEDGFSPVTVALVEDLEVQVGEMTIIDVHLLKSEDVVSQYAEVTKVDEELGLVFGWAIVSKIHGDPYFDLQGDHIPEDSMMESAMEFMIEKRHGGEMHRRDDNGEPVVVGKVVFCWPMTEETSKAFNIETSMTGLMIALKPDNDEILDKFRSGVYTGFSIGGSRNQAFDEEVD
jgi:hypothetical protein